MKITIFTTALGVGLLAALRIAGVRGINLAIIASVVIANTAFQVLVKGSIGWFGQSVSLKINKRIPTWLYSFISSVGLLAIVFMISRATSIIKCF